jgi:hypothetical protein
MKTKWLLLLLVGFMTSIAHAGVQKEFKLQDCNIEFLDKASAAEATGKSDAYSRALTPFDLQIRLGREKKVSEKDYLALSASQALSWDEGDISKLVQSLEEITTFLKEKNVHLNLPKNILFIKTAGNEEFGAEGYTRENRISLCIKPGQEITTHVVAHELFHVFSRFNPAIRDQIYAIFGFEKCNPINTAAAMDNRVITNPDCPFIMHFIALDIEGSQRKFVLQLYSTKPFQSNFGLESANVALLEVTGDNKTMQPLLKEGKGVLLQLDKTPELFEKISHNTPYVLHPEEIAAEHFSMWVIGQTKVEKPDFFDQLAQVLKDAK